MARMAFQQLRESLKNRPETYGIFGAPYITEETGELCQKGRNRVYRRRRQLFTFFRIDFYPGERESQPI